MDKLLQLKPKVKELAEKLVEECRKKGIRIRITCAFRSRKEQDSLYDIGRKTPGLKVTDAPGGYSFHNYGVAFDFCPIVKGKLEWNDLKLFDRVGKIGESLGLEWGGSWKKFKDRPHFQYRADYAIADFHKDSVDWTKFEV